MTGVVVPGPERPVEPVWWSLWSQQTIRSFARLIRLSKTLSDRQLRVARSMAMVAHPSPSSLLVEARAYLGWGESRKAVR